MKDDEGLIDYDYDAVAGPWQGTQYVHHVVGNKNASSPSLEPLYVRLNIRWTECAERNRNRDIAEYLKDHALRLIVVKPPKPPRTHCKYGHLYDRKYRRVNQCSICREAKRRRYEAKKNAGRNDAA